MFSRDLPVLQGLLSLLIKTSYKQSRKNYKEFENF